MGDGGIGNDWNVGFENRVAKRVILTCDVT